MSFKDQDVHRAAANKLHRLVVPHALQQAATDEVYAHASIGIPGKVTVVAGAPGTGVSRVLRAAQRMGQKSVDPENPYWFVRWPARVPLERQSDLHQFVLGGLEAIEEPLLGQHRRASESNRLITEYAQTATWFPHGKHRSRLHNGLLQRQCRAIMIEHAENLFTGSEYGDGERILRLLHEFASGPHGFPSAVVIGGTHQILEHFRSSSDIELYGRVVLLRCYDPSHAPDLQAFTLMLESFEQALAPALDTGTLTTNARDLCIATHGSTGWLKRVLDDAIVHQVQHDPHTPITWRGIKRYLPSSAKLKRLESENRTILQWIQEFRGTATYCDDAQRPSPRQRKRKPGTRNPANDPTGM